jgi:hypothetical protein
MKLNIIPKSLCRTLTPNDSTNDVDLIGAPKTRKLKSKVRKPKRSDVEWSNL